MRDHQSLAYGEKRRVKKGNHKEEKRVHNDKKRGRGHARKRERERG